MPRKTTDRASTTDDGLAVFTVDKLGDSREVTPEGFLLCKNVPFARAGMMLYGPNETPIKAGRDGIARVNRTKEELFRPETIASFNGKPIVNDHPDDDVTPETWRKLAGGIVLNPRPGTGEYDDCLVGDFLVTDKDLIKAVKDGKVEVSAGYDADYEDTDPGCGDQTNIIGNHVALVDRGRCGPRCAIGDRATVKENDMPARVKVHDKQNRRVHVIRKAFRDAENMAMEAFGLSPAGEGDDPDMDDPTEGDKDDDNHTHVHIHMGGGEDGPKQAAAAADDADPDADPAAADPNASLADRVTALEGSMQQIVGLLNEIKDGAGKGTPPPAEKTEPPPQAKTDDADPEEEKDPEEKEPTKTMDSAALENDFAATVALAEVLAPGFRAPTFDAAMPRAKTVDRMCQLRRKALDMAYATTEGHDLINTVHGKAKDQDIDLTAMACDEVSALFKSAAGARSLLNNRASVGDGKAPVDKPSIFGTRDASKQLPAVKSVNDLNGFYAKYYGQKKA